VWETLGLVFSGLLLAKFRFVSVPFVKRSEEDDGTRKKLSSIPKDD
jgi:hypothetical protein